VIGFALTHGRLTAKISAYCTAELGLEDGKPYDLYKKHGTCLRGLMEEKIIGDSDEAITGFLESVHDISYEVRPTRLLSPTDRNERRSSLSRRKSRLIQNSGPCSYACLSRDGSSPLPSRVTPSGVLQPWGSMTSLRASSTAGSSALSQCLS